jgi:hypothetical protein
MINEAEIRNDFRLRIAQSGIFDADQIAWENLPFNPENKSLWMREAYLPAVEERATSQGSVIAGIFQYSIFTPVGKGDVLSVEKGVALGSLWTPQEVVETVNYRITIDKTKCSFQGSLDDIWFSYIIDVEFKGYE